MSGPQAQTRSVASELSCERVLTTAYGHGGRRGRPLRTFWRRASRPPAPARVESALAAARATLSPRFTALRGKEGSEPPQHAHSPRVPRFDVLEGGQSPHEEVLDRPVVPLPRVERCESWRVTLRAPGRSVRATP